MTDGRLAGSVPTDRRLAGAVALVTGAGRGLGLAIAERLAAEGARVAALDLRPAVAADADGPAGAGPVMPVRCDVTDPDAVRNAVAEVVDRWGGIDVLVNNAGLLSGRAGLLTATPEQLHRFFAVNAVGALLTVQASFGHLRDSPRRGRVVNVASRTFFTGSPGQLGYVASKGALLGMTRVMARELGEHRITVNAVLPAQVATPGTLEHSGPEVFERTRSAQAIPDVVGAEPLAGMVAYLASPDGALVTGQTLVCDGGGLMH